MYRNHLLALLLLAASGLTHAAEPARPNIMLIIADDFTFSDVGCYGGQAHTPNIDSLARDGMKFSRCFQAAPMCSPTRHALYTGMYPIKTGAYPNHTFVSRPHTISIAQRLQSVGYRVALAGKTHIGPTSVFPFEYLPDPINAKSDSDFVVSAVAQKKPFCLIVASHNPHSPWKGGDPERYDPAKLKLPPVWADTPATRADFRAYLGKVGLLEKEVGDALNMLKATGTESNTLVIFLSEQGSAQPRAKWNLYDRGIQSACLVRWPGVVKPKTTTAAMIEYVDVLPTLLETIGAPRTPDLDGSSFLPVLLGQTNEHKKYVFAEHTNRGVIGGSEHYGIRSVRSEHYKYILNFTPEDSYKNESMNTATWKSWLRAAQSGNASARAAMDRVLHRPQVELYDILADPAEIHNLAGYSELASVQAQLRAELDAWMKAQGDLGEATEMAALEHTHRQAAGGGAKKKKIGGKSGNAIQDPAEE